MPARLAAFLAAEEPDATDIEVTSYEVMTGGYSRLLARAEVRWRRAGEVEQMTVVLRGDPPPNASLIDTDRRYEWEVLNAVSGYARVARPLYFDDEGHRLGTRAIVLEHSAAESMLPQARYSLASEVLSCVLEAAIGSGDPVAIDDARGVLQRRSDREMRVVGTLDLVGRG